MARPSRTFSRLSLSPITIAVGYTLIGATWIFFSDRILGFVGADMSVAHITRIQTLKGILYITLTAGLIYLLIAMAARQVRSSRNELDEVKMRYLHIFEKTGAVILIVDEATRSILDANAAAERFYGWNKADLVGKNIADIEIASNGKDQPFPGARHKLASGEGRDVTVNSTPVVADGRLIDFMLIHDVTEQRLLEGQLRQAQKMEAVGKLTAGIAHDLNNVLTVVLADADLVAAELQAGEAVQKDLDDLRAAARRGASMIRKLLSFSRSSNLRLVKLDLGMAVGNVIPALRQSLPDNITLQASNTSSGLVRIDEPALEQILLNLATNAVDAMPDGGTFQLETGRVWLDQSAQHPWVCSGDYIYLKATDSGLGMDQGTLSRMFEPFFTTKSPHEGSGLGMAMVYGLVKQHEGFVLVDSTPGGGTTVTIYLPPAPRLDQVEKDDWPGPREPGLGGETILLVEDEAAVRRAGQRILERLGYVVICADNGQRGLEILEEKGDSIDLVISDLVMPKIGGRGLYAAVRLRHGDMKFLFTSGYAPTSPGEGVASPEVPFIQKPWTLDELCGKVREVLDQAPR